MKYVFLALLIITSTIHLIDSWRDDAKKRARTKAFPLLLIVGYYLVSTDAPVWLLVAALLASWLGDVLLIPKGNLWFTFGGIAFAASHVLFMCTYLKEIHFPVVNWYVVVPIAIIYYIISGIIIYKLSPTTPKIMVPPMYIYLLTNSTMNLFALMQLYSNPCKGSVIAYIGAVLFFISDCTLFLVRYYKKPEVVFKKHFTVMATYIIGEFMIAQGILLL